jgi:protein-tyrosine phosphatase
MKRILVVCTANVCRSPMIAALLSNRFVRAGLGDRVHIASSGIYALVGEPADPAGVRLLAERGIDLSGHRATALDEEELRLADLILVSEEAHRQAIFYRSPQALHKVWLLTELNRGDGDLPDPYGEGEQAYVRVLAQIDAVLDEGWPRLLRKLDLA